MGIAYDDVVLIQQGKNPLDPTIVTVNCPDKPGLGCDLCRIILEFGLYITRGDFSVDGKWCYIVLWVVPNPDSNKFDWERLKDRLFSVCPSCLIQSYYDPRPKDPSSSPLYLFKFCGLDKQGSLHDITKALTKLEFTIQRVKVLTTPDGRVVDLFFITDGLELLHTKQRRDDTCEYMNHAFKESCISCEIQLAGPQFQNSFSSLPEAVADELFSTELSDNESLDKASMKKTNITVDNQLSPAHSLFQIECVDQKGLFYDILRTSKDCNIQITYGRSSTSVKGFRHVDLFIQQANGKKIVDPELQLELCTRLKEEILRPLRVMIANRGPDAELLVANPVELSGKGRPRAEIGRHSVSNRQWEVYRFLLDESREISLSSSQARSRIAGTVRKTLMGCIFITCIICIHTESATYLVSFRTHIDKDTESATYPFTYLLLIVFSKHKYDDEIRDKYLGRYSLGDEDCPVKMHAA
ncbi:hypothetical protein ACFE04_030450 [Oxalis oulophora]